MQGMHAADQLSAPGHTFGPADRVTLVRAVLTAVVAAGAVESVWSGRSLPILALVAAVALPLDALDGYVARRTGTSSAFGARFDMEVDAALILALSVLLVRPFGPWVLAAGLLRYVFALAGRVWPWLVAPLPPRFSRKAVAAAQGVVLTVAVGEILAPAVAASVVAAALAALLWSFARDVVLLAAARGASAAAAGPKAARNRSRNASILHTGAPGDGRSPASQPQGATRASAA